MTALLVGTKLKRTYRTDTVETDAISDLTVTVSTGEFVAIQGPSGCGKTTLLNILALLDRPSHGQLSFRGEDTSGLSFNQRARIRSEAIGMVFQSFNLLGDLSVIDNVLLPCALGGVRTREARLLAENLLDRVGLAHRMNHRPNQLSGGQQQRVAIARSLIRRPAVLFMDEPTGNLDSQASKQILQLVKDFHLQEKSAVVLVTHNPEIGRCADRLIQMSDGAIVSDARL